MRNSDERMTKAQANFYILRLRAFWNATECAEEVDCSLISWKRWERGENTPLKSMRPQFEKALETLTRRLIRKSSRPGAQFYQLLADALLQHDYPTFDAPQLPGVSLEYLREQLIDRLYKKEVRSTKILREFMGLGYTRMQIYYALKRLGVRKRQVQLGRGGYSLWTIRR